MLTRFPSLYSIPPSYPLLFLFCSFGGAFGSLVRYFFVEVFSSSETSGSTISYSSLTSNLIGSFLIGYLSQQLVYRPPFKPPLSSALLKAACQSGFLGGLTTFSGMAYDTSALLLSDDSSYSTYLFAFLSLFLHSVFGVAFFLLGSFLSTCIHIHSSKRSADHQTIQVN